MAILRQIRSTLTLGVLWGLGWSVAGAALGAYRVFYLTPFRDAWHFVLPVMLATATGFGLSGGVAGMAFAGMLVRAGRRQTLEQMTTGSVALWGAVAGVALPGCIGLIAAAGGAPIAGAATFLVVAGSVGAGVGALTAVTTLNLARRAPLDSGDPHLIRASS